MYPEISCWARKHVAPQLIKTLVLGLWAGSLERNIMCSQYLNETVTKGGYIIFFKKRNPAAEKLFPTSVMFIIGIFFLSLCFKHWIIIHMSWLEDILLWSFTLKEILRFENSMQVLHALAFFKVHPIFLLYFYSPVLFVKFFKFSQQKDLLNLDLILSTVFLCTVPSVLLPFEKDVAIFSCYW